MKTAEKIVAEIKDRKERYKKEMQAGGSLEVVYANYYISLLILLKWIEADDVTHDLGEEITIVHKGNQVLRTFRNEDY